MVPLLSDEQAADFRKRLAARRAELLEDVRQELLRSDNERYIDLAGTVHDHGEEAIADLLADLAIAEIDWQVREIADIERALQRIAVGSYGVCTDCGEEIDHERLAVYPTAKRCYACQQRYELARAEPGKGRRTL